MGFRQHFSQQSLRQLTQELATPVAARSRKFVVFCVCLSLATLLTWIIGIQDNRYIALEHADFGEVFPAQQAGWTKVGGSDTSSSAIDVYPDSGNNSGATFVVALPDSLSAHYNMIRVRSITHTLRRPSTTENKTNAGVLLRLLDKDDNIFQHSWVSRLTGEFNTHRDEYLTAIDPKTAAVQIRFSNRSSDGSFSLERVDIDIVKTSTLYQNFLLPLLILIWTALLLVSATYIIRKLGQTRTLTLVGILFVMVLGVLLPNSLRESIVNPVFDQLKALGLAGNDFALVHYYKVGHFLVFFAVSLILFYNTKPLRISIFELFGILVLVAIATEGAQLHLFFRSTQPLDIAIDVAGVTLALLIYTVTYKKLGRKKPGRRKKRRRSKVDAKAETIANTVTKAVTRSKSRSRSRSKSRSKAKAIE